MLGFRPLASGPLASGPLAEEEEEEVVVVVPQPQPQPAGGVPRGTYTPPRRKPERLVFLEREILEKRAREQERREELKRLAQETQARAQIDAEAERAQIEQRRFAIETELQQLQSAIAAIQEQIAFEIKLQQQIEQDEDDAIAVILMAATLH